MASVADTRTDADDDPSEISPELVLVDPDLARRLREREPAPVLDDTPPVPMLRLVSPEVPATVVEPPVTVAPPPVVESPVLPDVCEQPELEPEGEAQAVAPVAEPEREPAVATPVAEPEPEPEPEPELEPAVVVPVREPEPEPAAAVPVGEPESEPEAPHASAETLPRIVIDVEDLIVPRPVGEAELTAVRAPEPEARVAPAVESLPADKPVPVAAASSVAAHAQPAPWPATAPPTRRRGGGLLRVALGTVIASGLVIAVLQMTGESPLPAGVVPSWPVADDTAPKTGVPARKSTAPPSTKPKPAPAKRATIATEPRRFAWAPVTGAVGYHIELFRGADRVLAKDTKQAVLELGPTWRYEGRVMRLTKGSYRWYVWTVTSSGRNPQAIVQATLSVR